MGDVVEGGAHDPDRTLVGGRFDGWYRIENTTTVVEGIYWESVNMADGPRAERVERV